MNKVQKIQVNIDLSQKDFFENTLQTFKNKVLILRSCIRYLAFDDVLEIVEYDFFRRNRNNFVVTDGSELVTIPRKGGIARRVGVSFRIDDLITIQGKLYLSFRSINRLFNVDISSNLMRRQVFISQPGRFFISFRGDTFQSISELLNTSVRKLLAVNKNLKEPIQTGTRIRIPTIQPNSPEIKNIPKTIIKIKQTDKAAAIISLGRRLRGTRYKFGAGPYPRTKRFDCSSYVQYIFGQNGISLPRTCTNQAKVGKGIRQSDIEPGDLIFFRRVRYSDNRIGHCGVDIGNGRMLNTYQSPPGVTITRWRTPYWLNRYITAREIL